MGIETSTNPARVVSVIQGAVGQTADLIQVIDGAGVTVFSVDCDGIMYTSDVALFDWDSVGVTLTDEDVQTSAGAAVSKDYTVPTGTRWLLQNWRITPSAAKAITVITYKEAACTNLAEQWLQLAAPSAGAHYNSRGLSMANNYGWTDAELPAGTTIRFTMACDGAGQTMKSSIGYKEADAP